MKTECTHCGGHIEFESDSAGVEAACPHCGQDTLLVEGLHRRDSLARPPLENIPRSPEQTKHARREYIKALRARSCYPFAMGFVHLIWAVNVVFPAIGGVSVLIMSMFRGTSLTLGEGLASAGLCGLWIALAYLAREIVSVVFDAADMLADRCFATDSKRS